MKNRYNVSLVIVRIIAVVLIFFALSLLGMVLVSLYLHLFESYPAPKNVFWSINLVSLSIVSIVLILIAIQLFRRKNYARILTIASLFIISILNLRAELFIADSPSIPSLAINTLFLLSAFYLLFSKKVKNIFS